ncbi:MAG: adenylate/guanylate cyclase domain-containing response regulator, partial [Turneriella sp.]|nr:adenylate/guanylate cyclase domain-containing response regulator [Turneriella sp.]
LKHIRDTDGEVPIPVFMVSSEDSPELRIVSISTGADDFLTKPINLPDAAMKVQQALERYRYRKQIVELTKKLERDRANLKRYFADDLVEKILNGEITTELGGVMVPATILFFDVRGSTTIAERLGATAYAELINTVFADLMDIIFGNGGSVNELLGDGILATFGAPKPSPNDATNAIKSAVAIDKHMRMLNDLRCESGQFPLGFGMGIASGTVFAGNIGSVRMMKFAVMGDPVNLAARLQELTKTQPYAIIIDENTHKGCPPDIVCDRIGVTRVRGKTKSVALYGISKVEHKKPAAFTV